MVLQPRRCVCAAIIFFAAANTCRTYADRLVMLPNTKVLLVWCIITTHTQIRAIFLFEYVCMCVHVYVLQAQSKHLLMFPFCSSHCCCGCRFSLCLFLFFACITLLKRLTATTSLQTDAKGNTQNMRKSYFNTIWKQITKKYKKK